MEDPLGTLPRVSDEIANGADAFLERYPQEADKARLMIEDPVAWSKLEVQNLTKASREQYIRQLALAYTLLAKAARDEEYRRAVVALAAQKRLRITKRTQLVNLIVDVVLTYGDGSSENRIKYRGLYNRDAHAIRYLRAKNVPPDKVEELVKTKGEGPDQWSRQRQQAEVEEAGTAAEVTPPNSDATSGRIYLKVSGRLGSADNPKYLCR